MANEQHQQTTTSAANVQNDASLVSTANNGDTSVQADLPLAYDESLATALSAAYSGAETTATMTSSKSAADFFLDQIAAVVSDEKKLSDNIMDLIPPVETPISQPNAVMQGMNAGGTSSLGIPLQPPPGLMMRALSPPTSLLPDFGDLSSLALLGDTMVMTGSGDVAKPPIVTKAGKQELSSMKPEGAGTTTAMKRKVESIATVGAVQKKQKMDTVKPELVVNETAASVPVSVHQQQQTRQNLATSNISLSMSTAAAAAAAREKVMKEPQSGDLYECVITKRNGGLGLTLACVDDHVQITGLAPDTPAANSGISVGDTLVAVSGLPVRGLQFSTVIGRLKSTSRNSVVLKLRRNPFRQNAGSSASYRGMKRPGRSVVKGSDSNSNSANVLSSKTLALETRIGGGVGNGVNGSTGNVGGVSNNASMTVGVNDLHRSLQPDATDFTNYVTGLHHAQHLQVQLISEPMNSTYFPTDASTLTIGATAPICSSSNAVPPSAIAPSSFTPSDSHAGWRVNHEEKDRYYAECRALRHELGRSMVAQRIQKRDTANYTSQLQVVVDKFQEYVRSLESTSSVAESASTIAASSVPSTTANSDEVAALRQKLVEANQALAKQQTEILALQEREARHALPEAQRVKWQIVSRMRKSVLQIDCKAASEWSSLPSVKKIGVSVGPSLNFEERFDGVRPSTFALLVGQSSVRLESPTVELELSAKACTELLGWNLCEVVVQAAETYIVRVVDNVRVKYLQTEEALVVSWTLLVNDNSSTRK